MSSRASRPRSRQRLVGVSAFAVGALLTTYAGGLRNFSYVRAEPMSALSGCSGGATQVATDDSLQEAITNSVDDSVICITADITVSQTLVLDDTSITLEGDDSTVQLSGGGVTRVLYADFKDGADDTLTLRNLTFTQGTSLNADDSDGGAVLVRGNSRADTFIGENITVSDSYSFQDGGGIALASMEYVRLSGARFYDDSAASDSGAFEINFANSVVIENSVFKRNTAINQSGGAFEFQDVLDVRVYSSTFSDNESDNKGGSVHVFSGSNYLLLKDSTFTDDSTVNYGGSLALVDIAGVRLDDVYVRNGQAGRHGGAVYLKDDTYVQMINSTFTGNSSPDDGGAVYIDGSDDTVAVRNSGFYGNSTTGGGSGGGLYISDQDGPVVLEDVTAHDNTAASSGGFLRVFDLTSTLTITDMDSQRNYATADGGSIKQSSGTGILDLSNSTFADDSAGSDGGAIYFNDDSISITTSAFARNKAGESGGGVYVLYSRNSAITNSNFSSSYAGLRGGAVYIWTNDSVADEVYLAGLSFMDDSAVEDGGAIYVRSEGPIELFNVSASGTRALDDGGFAYLRSDDTSLAAADIRLVDLQITDSRTSDSVTADGGGLSIGYANSLYLDNVSVTYSRAGDDGGAMLVRRVDSVSIYDSTFSGNSAADSSGGVDLTNIYSGLVISGTTVDSNTSLDYAGGLYVRFGGDAQSSIVNSTFSGNTLSSTVVGDGGGMYLLGASGTSPRIALDFVTVTGNSAKDGGGAHIGGTLEAMVENSVIAGNSVTGDGTDLAIVGSATLDDSYSLFSSASAISGATADGPGTIFGAPKLNGLADNGGPTLTMLPQWDSPAFQAGDPNWTAPPANDQRGAGFPRDAGGRVSMGAVQGRSAKPVPPPAVPASPPREVQATAGDREVLVSWTAPSSTGTFPITAYQVDDSTGTHSCLLNVAPGDPLSCVIEDLTNGTAYSFRVRALTGAGWGAWSDFTADVTPEPGPSIMITGTREGRFAAVAGVTTGLVGETLIPRLRFPGPHAYKDGEARPVVDDAGDFTWQRQTRKKVYVYFFTEDRELRSNRVIIRPRG